MKKTIFTFLAILCATVLSHAAPLFQEDFDALNANASIVGQNGWVLVSGVSSDALVSNASSAWSGANFLNLFNGTTVRNGFVPVSLSDSDLKFGFYFMPNTSTAGHNLEISLRSSTSQVFYLGLRGTRASLDAGTSNAATTKYDFSSSLSAGTWYYFEATLASSSNILTFTVAPATGGTALLTQSITLSDTSIDRLYFGTTASTTSGEWLVDSVSLATIPETGTVAMILIGSPLLALGGWRTLRR